MADPFEDRNTPLGIRIVVIFPAPFGPRQPKAMPLGTFHQAIQDRHSLTTVTIDFGKVVRFDGIHHSFGLLIERSWIVGNHARNQTSRTVFDENVTHQHAMKYPLETINLTPRRKIRFKIDLRQGFCKSGF
jgi:hypothetical protein